MIVRLIASARPAPRPSHLLVMALLAGCLACTGPAGDRLAASSAGLALPDLDGRTHRPLDGGPDQVVAIVFVAVDCPIANASLPEIGRVHQTLSAAGGRLYLVHPRIGQSAADATRHAEEFELAMPILLDDEQLLVGQLGATVTPEAFVLVLGADGPELVYRGRIDDLYTDLGRRRAEATRPELRLAVEAALEGRRPQASAPAIGCLIERRR